MVVTVAALAAATVWTPAERVEHSNHLWSGNVLTLTGCHGVSRIETHSSSPELVAAPLWTLPSTIGKPGTQEGATWTTVRVHGTFATALFLLILSTGAGLALAFRSSGPRQTGTR